MEATQELTEKQKKKIADLEADKKYKANEIKYGIRYKLITVVSIIVLLVVIVITTIAVNNQTRSLLIEKEKQGDIIVRGLSSSIKTRLLDIYASETETIEKLNATQDFIKFYKVNGISETIFEDIDAVKTQPDVMYAYILGQKTIVLGHSDPEVRQYSVYHFPENIKSYFESYKELDLDKPTPVLKKINYYPDKNNQNKSIEVIDFSTMLAFKTDAALKDAIGEVHIGISLESVNQQIFDSKVQMQLIGFIAIIAGVILAILVATFIARPIRKMIVSMQEVTHGNFNASVVLKSKDEVGLLSKTFNNMLQGLSILVSPEVAQVVLSGTDLIKSGQKRVVTVLFSDIRGFTTISESLTPHQVVEMLNDYMEVMTEVIIKFGGVVDKFVGDEIFAVFGAPFDHPIHPLAAIATALTMDIELAQHNKERENEGKLPIKIGIGVNTGDVISGAMGSKKRIDFTSIGDAVNLGARLEGTNKVYGTLVIISEFTLEYVQDDVIVRELDSIRVKGKLEPVLIYEPIALTEAGEQKIKNFLIQLDRGS